jgi:aminoglycoside 6'-N-acetyltransferase
MSGRSYSFRRVDRSDLALLRTWLNTPEVVRWWGDPAGQATLLDDDLDNPQMAMRIVMHEGRPFAYTQDYNVHAWPQEHLRHLLPGSRAIDSFIGEPSMIGKGHGSAFRRMLGERLIAEGAPIVAVDPAVDNFRARRAYENAGFHDRGVFDTGEGPVVLMIFQAQSTTCGSGSADLKI